MTETPKSPKKTKSELRRAGFRGVWVCRVPPVILGAGVS